jgi:hypothetical protein
MYATFFDRYLVERSLLTEGQRLRALQQQRESDRRVGDLALQMGLLTAEERALVLEAQRPQDRLFGELAVEMGLMRREDLERVLERKREAQVPLTDILIGERLLAPQEVSRAWVQWKRMQDWRERSNQLVLQHLDHGALAEAALEVCRKGLWRCAQIRSELAVVSHDLADLELRAWLITVPVFGDFRGRLMLSMGESVLLAIASQMSGRAITALDEEAMGQVQSFARGFSQQLQRREGLLERVFLGAPRVQRAGEGAARAARRASAAALRLDLQLPDHRPETLWLGLVEDALAWRITDQVAWAA